MLLWRARATAHHECPAYIPPGPGRGPVIRAEIAAPGMPCVRECGWIHADSVSHAAYVMARALGVHVIQVTAVELIADAQLEFHADAHLGFRADTDASK